MIHGTTASRLRTSRPLTLWNTFDNRQGGLTDRRASVIHCGGVKPIRIIRQQRITSVINYEAVQHTFIKVIGWRSCRDSVGRHTGLANDCDTTTNRTFRPTDKCKAQNVAIIVETKREINSRGRRELLAAWGNLSAKEISNSHGQSETRRIASE